MDPDSIRKYALLVGGLALNEAAGALVASGASESILLGLCKGDFKQAQRFEAWINATGTAADFALKPLVGSLLDAWGRRWAVLAGQLGFATLRALTWRYPSLKVYTLLRLGLRLLSSLMGPAIAATQADLLGGRASPAYTAAIQRAYAALACGHLLGLALATRLRLASTNFGFAALCNVLSAGLMCCVGETLRQEGRNSLKFVHPFSWVSFFGRAPRLRRLAVALAIGHAAGSNPTDRFVVFQRFGLTPQERSRMSSVEMLVALPFQLMVVGQVMLKRLGNELAARWSGRFAVVERMNFAFARHLSLLYLNPCLQSLQPGELALQSEVALEAAGATGHGELEAALASLALPVQLLAPPLFAELCAWRPQAPLLLVALLHLARSELVVPWVFRAPTAGARQAPLPTG